MFAQARKLTFTVSTLLLLTFAVGAQEQKIETIDNIGVSERPLNCENTFQLMEEVQRLVRAGTNEKSVLILIARRGNGETSRTLNRRRLSNVREGFQITLGIEKPIVIAEGERINGFGRVEIYLDGEFIGALLAQKNSGVIKCQF